MREVFTILILLLGLYTPAQTTLHTTQLCQHSSNIAAYKVLTEHSFIQCGYRANFCTKELMDKNLNIGILKGNNAFTCHLSHCGHTLFGELDLQVGYARCFGDKLAIALQGIYLMQHATHYESQHSFTVDFSIAYQISRYLLIAIDLYNPIRMKYGITGKEIIPMSFYVEVNYQRNEKLSATLFCQKTLPGHIDIGLALGYQPTLSLIVSGNCTLHKCGIGVHIPWKKLMFSIQCDWHYRISFSPESNILFVL